MKVFALVNQKGGVGKTTTAVNLATALAATGKKTLLIDLDSQGNASTAFGIDPQERYPNSYDLLMEETRTIDAVQETEIPKLYIIPAVIDLSACDLQLASKIGREFILSKKLEELKDSDFDYVFLDCPPSLGLLTVNSLSAADYALIPLQCEFYSLEGLSYLLNTVELVKDSLNPELRIGGLVLTMYDKRNKLTNDVEKEVKKHFGDDLFETYIPRNVKLSEAPSHGKPGIIYDHRSTGAKAYMMLAREFIKRFENLYKKAA